MYFNVEQCFIEPGFIHGRIPAKIVSNDGTHFLVAEILKDMRSSESERATPVLVDEHVKIAVQTMLLLRQAFNRMTYGRRLTYDGPKKIKKHLEGVGKTHSKTDD